MRQKIRTVSYSWHLHTSAIITKKKCYLSLTLSTTNGSSTAVRPGIVIVDSRPPVFRQIDFPAKDGLNRKWRIVNMTILRMYCLRICFALRTLRGHNAGSPLPQVWLILFVAFVLLYRLIYLSPCHDLFNKPPAQTRQHGTAEKRKRKKIPAHNKGNHSHRRQKH